jgi:zinc protease
MKITRLMKKLFIICLSVLFLFINHTFTQDSAIPMDPKVRYGKLDNGLTYYVRENPKPEDKVELRLVVNAGSILEDDDQQGLAHFMEHMCFNGLKHFEKNELVDYLQSIGVKIWFSPKCFHKFRSNGLYVADPNR